MALDGTYAGMQASIADFLNRTDLSTSIPDFILLAETDLNRSLRVRAMVATTTLTSSTSSFTLPADYLATVSVKNAQGQPLDQIGKDAFDDNAANYGSGAGTSYPSSFNISGSSLATYPTFTTATTLTFTYFQKIPALVSNTAGNWLSLSSPDAYLYGALSAAAPYLQADERLQVWGSLYSNAVSGIMMADQSRFGERLTPLPAITQII